MTRPDRNVPPAAGSSTVVVGFAASDGQLGRTAAISNAAWILASDGRRVLIVDWNAACGRKQ
jgi:Mrp family chromosome partitioning ATPase